MIFVSAIGFGSYGVWSRLIGPEFGVFFQGWTRSALVLLFLIPLAIVTKNLKPIKAADWKWLLTAVGFGIATQAPLYYAFNHLDIGTATLIFYSTYLITSYIIGRFLLGEKIGVIKVISLILAFVGLTLIFGLSLAKFSIFAMLLAVVNGIASGGEVSTTKKSTQKFSSLQVSIFVWLGILITHLPLSILLGEPQIPFSFSPTWLAMFGFATAGLISFWLVVEGFKFVDASIGGLIGLLEIVFGVLFGLLFFHEQLSFSIISGGFFIIFAAMLPDLVSIYKNNGAKKELI